MFSIRGRWLCWRTITQALCTTTWSVSKLAIARTLGPLLMLVVFCFPAVQQKPPFSSSQEIQAKISFFWWIHHFCPVGDPEAERLRGREQHPYPHRSWEASLWERSRWLVHVGHPLPSGRSAKHQAAAWQHWRLPIVVGHCPRLDILLKWLSIRTARTVTDVGYVLVSIHWFW